MDLIETLRTLRNGAADNGDMETAYRHERRLQILLGVPASFTEKRTAACIVCQGAPCVCPELFEDDGAEPLDPEWDSEAEELADFGREDF